ncbi:MAG: transcriptional regulator [Nostocoides sp.]
MAALSALERGDTVSFTRLRQLLDLTAGNLLTHLRRLEQAGYVVTDRRGGGRNGQTSTALTDRGRVALADYRKTLTAILDGKDPVDTKPR